MQLDFLVASSHQVVDDVRGGSVAAGAAEPLVAGKALDDTAWVVDTAVSWEKLGLSLIVLKMYGGQHTRMHDQAIPRALPLQHDHVRLRR